MMKKTNSNSFGAKDIYRYERVKALEYIDAIKKLLSKETKILKQADEELKTFIKETTVLDAPEHHIRAASMNGHTLWLLDHVLLQINKAEALLVHAPGWLERLKAAFKEYKKATNKAQITEYSPSSFEGDVSNLRERITEGKRMVKDLEAELVRLFPEESKLNNRGTKAQVAFSNTTTAQSAAGGSISTGSLKPPQTPTNTQGGGIFGGGGKETTGSSGTSYIGGLYGGTNNANGGKGSLGTGKN
ncbi:hypothetical protein DFH27DRAFT_609780 [Peziza echinospora]|nr:hypothetical protein DFH27DRAFT_609780 [Peziza echinospora]